MRLDDVLFSQGFGTRRLCAGLIEQGYVAVAGHCSLQGGASMIYANLLRADKTKSTRPPA